MANLVLGSDWVSGIYQLEIADPVQGGPEGIDNLQAKQLGARTNYLKAALEALAPIDINEQNSLWSALKFALEQAQVANTGVMSLRQLAQQEGEITLTNRGVVNGCVVTKSVTATRNLHIAAGTCFARGRRFSVPAGENVASVPANTSGAAQVVSAYLYPDAGDIYRLAVTAIGQAIPANGIRLYNLTIPNNSTDGTDPNLTSVTLTDVRRQESLFPRLLDSAATSAVVIQMLSANNYRLDFEVVSAVGAPCPSKAITVTSRATNGFTVALASAADDVVVRWRLSKLNN